jgi:putative transposase
MPAATSDPVTFAGLEKKLRRSADQLRPLIDPDHAELSVRRQCQLVGLSRATYYLPAAPESAENLALMRLIDEQYTACPFYGSRRITRWLARNGHEVNRKRVQRLLRLMGLEAIHPKPKLSAGRGHCTRTCCGAFRSTGSARCGRPTSHTCR